MSNKFLIELDEKKILPTIEGLTVINLCDFKNWYTGSSDYKYIFGIHKRDRFYSDIRDAAIDIRKDPSEINFKTLIPVGSLQFIEGIKLELTGKPLSVINIPLELNDKHFLHRNCRVLSLKAVKAFKEALDFESCRKTIIKPASNIKSFECATLDMIDLDKCSDTHVFISDWIDIEAEWRVFVYKGFIRGIRQYSGNDIKNQDKTSIKFIEECISTYKDCPTAYTLDIGKTKDGHFVVIEVHNFVGCGLYGFEDTCLLDMYKAGWKYEISKA